MALPPNFKRDYFTSQQIADRYRLAEKSVRRQRSEKRGPPFVKFNGRVFYKKEDVMRWETAQLKDQPDGKARALKRR